MTRNTVNHFNYRESQRARREAKRARDALRSALREAELSLALRDVESMELSFEADGNMVSYPIDRELDKAVA